MDLDLDLNLGDIGLDAEIDLSGFSVDIEGAGLNFSTRYAKPPIFKGIPDRLVMIETPRSWRHRLESNEA